MVVEYASFELGTADVEGFQQWVLPLVAACRAEDGCLAYEFKIDRSDPPTGSLFQAWESPAAFEAHLVFPAHDEMLKSGAKWGNRNVRILRWTNADGFAEIAHEG
jgi:quinol monooxygenase YgiN